MPVELAPLVELAAHGVGQAVVVAACGAHHPLVSQAFDAHRLERVGGPELAIAQLPFLGPSPHVHVARLSNSHRVLLAARHALDPLAPIDVCDHDDNIDGTGIRACVRV
jgi:hypothetical protein